MPLVSVVMPVYNTRPDFFREAIKSVLEQSYKRIELIIVDDCSEEYINSIVQEYEDDRIRYFRIDEVIGVANVKNIGIENAQGKYIAFLDSDDLSVENRLKYEVEYLENDPTLCFVCSDVKIINSDDKHICPYSFPKDDKTLRTILFTFGNAIFLSTLMVRRSIVNKYRIKFKTEYWPSEDYKFILTLSENYTFKVIPQKLTIYRWCDTKSSRLPQEKQKVKCLHALYKFQQKKFWTTYEKRLKKQGEKK